MYRSMYSLGTNIYEAHFCYSVNELESFSHFMEWAASQWVMDQYKRLVVYHPQSLSCGEVQN